MKEFIIGIFIAIASICVYAGFVGIFYNDDNNQPKRETKIVHLTDTLHDTIYISVPDQNAYNIGYWDGNFDAQNGNIIGIDND